MGLRGFFFLAREKISAKNEKNVTPQETDRKYCL
jgi:hypothetical protein